MTAALLRLLTRPLAVAALGFALGAASPRLPAAETPAVAAAADLKFALADLIERYAGETGAAVRVSYGSSGQFARQIAQGAPFELFLSADERYVQQLAEAGRTRDAGVPYARGRLALFVPAGSTLAPAADLADLGAALADGRVQKFAIANPEHAPYGRAAAEVLHRAGLWEAVAPKLVLGENAAQAAQFAASGAAQGGLIPLALAMSPAFAGRGRWVAIPADRHAPLRQRMVLLSAAGPQAEAFYRYLQTPAARALLARYGFEAPDAAP